MSEMREKKSAYLSIENPKVSSAASRSNHYVSNFTPPKLPPPPHPCRNLGSAPGLSRGFLRFSLSQPLPQPPPVVEIFPKLFISLVTILPF